MDSYVKQDFHDVLQIETRAAFYGNRSVQTLDIFRELPNNDYLKIDSIFSPFLVHRERIRSTKDCFLPTISNPGIDLVEEMLKNYYAGSKMWYAIIDTPSSIATGEYTFDFLFSLIYANINSYRVVEELSFYKIDYRSYKPIEKFCLCLYNFCAGFGLKFSYHQIQYSS